MVTVFKSLQGMTNVYLRSSRAFTFVPSVVHPSLELFVAWFTAGDLKRIVAISQYQWPLVDAPVTTRPLGA